MGEARPFRMPLKDEREGLSWEGILSLLRTTPPPTPCKALCPQSWVGTQLHSQLLGLGRVCGTQHLRFVVCKMGGLLGPAPCGVSED